MRCRRPAGSVRMTLKACRTCEACPQRSSEPIPRRPWGRLSGKNPGEIANVRAAPRRYKDKGSIDRAAGPAAMELVLAGGAR